MIERMRRFLMPACLLVFWLVINKSLAGADWLLGGAFALAANALTRRVRPLHAVPRHLGVMLALCGRVLADIVRANIETGQVILYAARRPPHSAFLDIPLEMRNPHGLAMLSIIITAMPGTAWAGLNPENNVLTLHVLDLKDSAGVQRTIKERYERPLMEIFT